MGGSTIIGFSGVTIIAILATLISAIRKVWPVRHYIIAFYTIFVLYIFEVHNAIVWVVKGVIQLL